MDRKVVLTAIMVALATVAGCGFSSPAASKCGPNNSPNWIKCMLDLAPERAVDSDARKIVYEAPGLIRVLHGRSCADVPKAASGSSLGLRVQGTESVPLSIADSGTVFMNGWELRYKNGDHHVEGLGSAIVDVQTTRSEDQLTLSWQAGGVLADLNGDDPYQWCYSYTIMFWNRSSTAFDAMVSNTDATFLHDTPADPGNESAIRVLPSQAAHPYGPGVVLPQGFAMVLHGEDHHLLQLGLDYGQPMSIEPGQLHWTTRTMLRDNERRRDYYAGALVSTLTYASPAAYHPSFVEHDTLQGWLKESNDVKLTPDSPALLCEPGRKATRTEKYKIANVPFDYAVPVLKGWELGFVCTDHHVRDLGASITDFEFIRNVDGKGGTLFYTLELTLTDDGGNVNYGQASVDVFGMNRHRFVNKPLTLDDLQ